MKFTCFDLNWFYGEEYFTEYSGGVIYAYFSKSKPFSLFVYYLFIYFIYFTIIFIISIFYFYYCCYYYYFYY